MKVTEYQKPTHTDQHLNFHSNHHLQHKQTVVNILLVGAQTLVTQKVDKVKEIQHVKQALKTPPWMLPNPAEKGGRLGVGLATLPCKNHVATETPMINQQALQVLEEEGLSLRRCMTSYEES